MKSLASFSDRRQQQIIEATKEDPALQELIKVLEQKSGWPENRGFLEPEVRPYFDFQEEMCEINGIVFKGERVVIPAKMQSEMLRLIHESHLGMVKCKKLARDIMFWPGMSKQIEDVVSKCATCQVHRSSQQKEPLICSEVPSGPWSTVASDLFECLGSKYLIVVDYYSDFFEVELMDQDTTSASVIEKTSKIFATHGIATKLVSDNGPQYSSHLFAKFSKEWGFEHVTISPGNSRANGKAEKSVGIAKKMMIKCHEDKTSFQNALLNYRNTPGEQGGSPAQRLFGRRTKTKLPTTGALLKPQTQSPEQVQKQIAQRRETAKRYYDVHAKPLEPLTQADTVRIHSGKTWLPAQYVKQNETTPRSYHVLAPSGQILRRNRQDLLKTKEPDIFRPEPFDVDFDENPVRSNVPITQTQAPINRAVQNPMIPPAQNASSYQPITTTKVTRQGRDVVLPRYLNDYVRS